MKRYVRSGSTGGKKEYKIQRQLELTTYGKAYRFEFMVSPASNRSPAAWGMIFIPNSLVREDGGYTYIQKWILDKKLKDLGLSARDVLGSDFEVV